jgi:hypothetical protein
MQAENTFLSVFSGQNPKGQAQPDYAAEQTVRNAIIDGKNT